jgi:hypothetical protein
MKGSEYGMKANTENFLPVNLCNVATLLRGEEENIYMPSYHYKIPLNVIHPPTSWSSWWSLSFWLSHQ